MKRYRFSSGDEEKSRKAEQQFLRITENMTDEEKLKQGFNGSTYSINGRDVDL